MPKIRITDETNRALISLAIRDVNETKDQRLFDGTWLIDITDEVAMRIYENALPGETLDDAIQRVIRQSRGDKPN